MISAVCVLSIPNDEERRIKGISVFIVTASFSVLAYLWIYVILVFITPDRVTLIEALITLIMFPVLLISAYFTDVRFSSEIRVAPILARFPTRRTIQLVL